MTLRLRLVLALVALVVVAQGAFFYGTYTVFRNSEYSRLDAQLKSVEPLADNQLDLQTGAHGPSQSQQHGGEGNQGGGPPPAALAPYTYVESISASGKVTRLQEQGSSTVTPKLGSLPAPGPNGVLLTVPASSGNGTFRVYVHEGADGSRTIIAIPTTGVVEALEHLALIEALAIGGLLVVVSAGAWLVLRRGLRPLERMATTARSIAGGDLSPRVTTARGGTEVAQLGVALNSMLDRIEEAFAERQATEDRLRQFLADASHELRTPLTSIQGFTELFRLSGDQARVDLPTILRRIEEESARMRLLVEDLLLLARLDQPRDAERRPVDLTVLAADACSDAVAADHDRPVRLSAPGPVVVAGDPAHLRQAVANLVANALKHTPPGTPVEVGAAAEGDGARLWVRDHGGGLDPTALAHVFDRFWQADRARVGQGFGLGLSIVSAIAAEHGGRAEAGNADGGGAVFTLHLPARLAADPTLGDPVPAGV